MLTKREGKLRTAGMHHGGPVRWRSGVVPGSRPDAQAAQLCELERKEYNPREHERPLQTNKWLIKTRRMTERARACECERPTNALLRPHSLALSLSLSPFLSLSRSLSIPFSLSLSFSHSRSLSLSLPHTHTLSLSSPLSLYL